MKRIRKTFPVTATLLLLLAGGFGCRSLPPLPPADLSTPGWTVLQGQAVWKPTQSRPEMTGDLLLATNVDGSFFVQFTKNPFPLVTAERLQTRWQIEFGADQHSWRGLGKPPARFGWFQLPGALLNDRVDADWQFENSTNAEWRLENARTGETLEGGFFP